MTINWNADMIERLCDEIASGKGIIEVGGTGDFPSAPTIYRHMANDSDFDTRIARARAAQQDSEADRIIEMAEKATAEDWQVVQLRIRARQWRASKLAPMRYGDKLDLTTAGKPVGTADDAALAARLAAIMAGAQVRKDADNGNG